ncbi:hypothetical protein AB3S75_039990 [Citrus x aurantiifolia]
MAMKTLSPKPAEIKPLAYNCSSSIEPLGYNIWGINFGEDYFVTTVTSCASDVDRWIARTINVHRWRLHKLVVGLDTEWCLPIETNKHQKVAIIQLCVGQRCLVFQLCHKDRMPQSLVDFLENDKFTFVGKGIENDANKLYQDYGLNVARTMDVADMAAAKYDDEELKRFGLKRLVLKFLHVEMEKSKRITLSKWDVNKLSKQQIRYAAIDAFVSFKLAIELKKEIIAVPKPITFDAFVSFKLDHELTKPGIY